MGRLSAGQIAALEEGDALPVLDITPGMDLVIRYCGLTGGLTNIFYDAEAAHAAGMPGPIVPGQLKTWLLYRALDTWLGGAGFVRHVRTTHRRPDLTGRPMSIAGTVARIGEEGGQRLVDIEIVVVGSEGQPTVNGFGTVQLR
ncbi:MAG: hypothetical protein IT303_06935 [Dehalococcoidia bacterium]|nr:hypothetical protein [Dehalococcoidia bacterium]